MGKFGRAGTRKKFAARGGVGKGRRKKAEDQTWRRTAETQKLRKGDEERWEQGNRNFDHG